MRELEDRDLAARKLLHTTVFAQCFSPCGKYLVAANNYGYIAVFSLTSALAPDASDDTRKPIYSFKANESGAIYSLVSTDILLIGAGNGDIQAWKWSEVLDKAAKVVWCIKVPKLKAFGDPEINSLALDPKDSGTELYGGCGDNNVYVWDIETGLEKGVFTGHTDYIHCICLKNSGRECISASEDGTVRIWDSRTRVTEHLLEPNNHDITARPDIGRWVSCVACDSNEDWLVCGGGPHLSAWHLRSLQPMAVFDSPKQTHNFVRFHDDMLMSGGSERFANHWFMNGELKSKVPCSPTNVFSMAINTQSESNKVLSVAGSSPKIDICTNFGYTAFSLKFFT